MNRTSTMVIASLLGSALVAQESPTGQPDKRPPTTQSPQKPQDPQNRGGQDGTSSQQENDQVLISWLLIDNENEVALARIAVQRAQDPQVKQFAQTMIDDHGKMVDELKQANGGGARLGQDSRRQPSTGTERSPDGQQPADRQRGTDGTTEASGSGRRQAENASGVRMVGGFDHRQLIRDLGTKCRQSATEMLQQKQGAEFDRCYMGMQVAAHMKAVDTLEVFRGYASPSLRSSIEKSLATVKQHKQQAEQLVEQLASDGHKTATNGGR